MQETVRVLVAEDDALVAEMIQGLLESIGYQIAGVAENGQQVLDFAPTWNPDIILMDIDMPIMDGITAAERIRETYPLPVVMLTAYETPDLVKRASAAGVGAYLIKPPNVREVERAITIAMARFADMMALRRLNDELDAYAHTVAHDLKSPLSSVIGFSEVLAEEGMTLSGEEQRRYLNLVAQSGHKMVNIIDELLLLASVRKRDDVPLEPIDTGAIVASAQQRLADIIEDTQVEIVTTGIWPIALGYAPWVEEIWVNYLSNAIKYGGQPPFVWMGYDLLPSSDPENNAGSTGGNLPKERPKITSFTNTESVSSQIVRFWVRDNGPGIPKELQSRIFIPFERPTQVRAKGHGLGLSIVRRIVEKLGGEVGFESPLHSALFAPADGGSVFWFTLPIAELD